MLKIIRNLMSEWTIEKKTLPTCVHGPTPEECSISVNTPSMTSGMFPRDLEDVCCLLNKMQKRSTENIMLILIPDYLSFI